MIEEKEIFEKEIETDDRDEKNTNKWCVELRYIINGGSDLLNDYGFGITAYFDILLKLFFIFCVISVFAICLMVYYKREG